MRRELDRGKRSQRDYRATEHDAMKRREGAAVCSKHEATKVFHRDGD